MKNKKGDLVSPSQLDETWFNNTVNANFDKIKLLYVGRIKIEKGINSLTSKATDDGGDSPFSLQMAEKTIYTTLTEEIRKTLRYYMKNSPQAFFNKFYLTGGSAALPGLVDSLSENLNMKVEILDPFEKIENADGIENPSQYAIAVGAAIRGLEKKAKSKE